MSRRLSRVRRSTFRGAGMVLVILVSSLILTVGLALGTLCTLNLNFAHQDLTNQQFRLMAKAGMEQVQAILTQRGGLKIGIPDPAQPGNSVPPLLKTLVPATLFDETVGFPGKCQVTFDPNQAFYSYDNTPSELTATGYHQRQVPPFSVDLLLNMTIGGMTRHYEAILTQRWQYNAFDGSGEVVVNDAAVQGSVFSNAAPSGTLVNVGSGIALPAQSPQGYGACGPIPAAFQPPPGPPPGPPLLPPPPQPASVTGDACVQTVLDPLAIQAQNGDLLGRKRYGMDLINVPAGTSPTDYFSPFDFTQFQTPSLPGAPGSLKQPPPPPSPPMGQLDLSKIENSAYMSVTVNVTSTATACCGTITTDVNSVTNYYVWLPSLRGNDPASVVGDCLSHKLYFMTGDVNVGANGAGLSQYYVDGCLFNHAYLYLCPFDPLTATAAEISQFVLTPTGISTTAAGHLNINDAALYISHDGDFTDIQGNNAALYLGGSLALNGGNLNANDKGMVITANGVSLTCGGVFNGFICSTKDILISTPTPDGTVIPPPTAPLKMAGGLLSDTGTLVVDAGTTINYAPQYTKVLNQFADVQPVMFQEVSY